MKQGTSLSFTSEQFEQNWSRIDRLRRKARVMSVIAGTGGFLTNLFFLFSILLTVNGLIYQNCHGSYHTFLGTIPGFSNLWKTLSDFLFLPGDAISTQIGKTLLCIYIVSIILFASLALVIALLYHPRKRMPSGGTYQEQAKQLANLAAEAWSQSYKTRISTSIASTLLVIVTAFLLFFAYTIYLDDPQAAAMLLCVFPTKEYTTNAMLYVFFAYLLSNVFSTILLTLTRPIYRYQFPQNLMVQAQRASLLADHNLLEEEEISTWSAALCRDAILTEQKSGYRKAMPMFYDAALTGNTAAMEHYARHCLIGHLNDSARYWLKRCAAMPDCSPTAKRMLLRLRLGLQHNVRYLHQEQAPLSKGQKFRRILGTVFKVIWRIVIILALVSIVAICMLLYRSNFDLNVFHDLPAAFAYYFG